MNKLPLVSIIIPSYNHKQFLRECLDSIFNNGYENIQVVVIDDNSTDGSKEVLRKLKNKYPFDLVIKEESKGLVDSLNLFLKKHCKGDYYKPVSSDDIIIKGSIAKTIKEFQQNVNIDVIIGAAIGIDENSNKIKEYPVKCKGSLSYKNFLLGNITYNITATFYRTRIHKLIGMYQEGVVSEDIYFSRSIWKNLNIHIVDYYISGYRTHNTNTSKDSWLMYQESLKALKALEGDEFYELKKRREYLNFFASLSKNHKKEAFKYLMPSLRFWNDKLFLIGIVNLLGITRLVKKLVKQE